MTDIPDEVVERARKAIASELCTGDCQPPSYDDCPCERVARAAGRVFVEWERGECARVAEQYVELVRFPPVHDLHSALDGWGARSIAAAILARSEGD